MQYFCPFKQFYNSPFICTLVTQKFLELLSFQRWTRDGRVSKYILVNSSTYKVAFLVGKFLKCEIAFLNLLTYA